MITALAASALLTQVSGPIQISRLQTFTNVKATAVAASPKGSLFAVSDYNRVIRIMDAKTCKTVFSLTGAPQNVLGLAFTPDGKQLVSGDESARIWIWDVKTGHKLRELPRTAQTHQRGVQAISFTADGKTMITTSSDDTLIVWDYAAGTPKLKVAGNGVVFSSARIASNGMVMVGTMTEGLQFRKGPAYTLTSKVNGHEDQGITDVAMNLAGTKAVTSGRNMKAVVWDVLHMKKLGTLYGHQDYVQKAAISPDGKYAATSSNERLVYVWDLKTMKPITVIKDQCAVSSPLAFTGDGKYLITVNVDDSLQVNSIVPTKPVKPVKTPAKTGSKPK